MPILSNEERIGTTVLDRYAIKRLLGEGGMGAVFEGTHNVTRRRVAIKSLHPEYATKSEVVQRFFQEAHAATSINHPNIVQVLDMGVDAATGAAFLVLEFLDGEDLNAVLQREQRLNVQRTVESLLPVMSALSAAHAKGIVHRDIKPANIFLARQDDGSIVPKLLDFGISKMTGGDALARTSTGAILGTPFYMAPEQARGERTVDHLVDVWAMGVVLYQCLSGALPFAADNYNQMILKLITEEPPPLAGLVPGLPSNVVSAVHKALSKDRANRWPTMSALAAALSEYARPDTTGRSSVPSAQAVALALDHTQHAMQAPVAGPPTPVAIPRTSINEPVAAPSTAMSWSAQGASAASTPVQAAANKPRSNVALIAAGAVAVLLVGAGAGVALSKRGAPETPSQGATSEGAPRATETNALAPTAPIAQQQPVSADAAVAQSAAQPAANSEATTASGRRRGISARSRSGGVTVTTPTGTTSVTTPTVTVQRNAAQPSGPQMMGWPGNN